MFWGIWQLLLWSFLCYNVPREFFELWFEVIINFLFMLETNNSGRWLKIFDSLAYVVLGLQVLLMPLFLDKNLLNFFVLPKQVILVVFVLLGIFLLALRTILLKKIVHRKTFLDWSFLIFFILIFFSAIFSVDLSDSFLGRTDWFGLNFIFLTFGLLFYFVLVNQLHSPAQWRRLLDVLLLSGALAGILFLLKVVLGFSFPGWDGIWTSVSTTNSQFGIWTVFQLFLVFAFLMRKNLLTFKLVFYICLLVLHSAVLLVLGFSFIWWYLLLALVLALILGVVLLREVRVSWLSVLFALLIVTVVFIVFGSPKSLQGALPSEISLSSSASWNITSATIFSGAKNFLLGSGLGTFATDFSKFKTADFNYNSLAWSLRFNQPVNTFFAILSEGGVLLSLLLIFIFLFILGYAIHLLYSLRLKNILKKSKEIEIDPNNDFYLEVFVLLGAWVLLSAGMGFVFFNAVLWWAWWLILGLLVFGLYQLGGEIIIKEKVWALEETPQHSLVFSFALIIVMALVVMLGVLGAKFYLAEYNYTRAVNNNDLKTAEDYLLKAIEQRNGFDMYHVALARVYMLQASAQMAQKEPALDQVAGLVAKAVNQAKWATDLSPKSVAIWENLATMYENAATLVPEAGEWAVKSINQAIELEPTNPTLYWRLGNVYLQLGDQEKAQENYEKAIAQKSDYLSAYAGLSAIYEGKKDLTKAIEVYSVLLSAASNNPEVLFNLGRLHYNRRQTGDYTKAEQLWLEAVRLKSDYSNALYSLGLLYENRGEKTKALDYYYQVRDINPQNQEIINKISNLAKPTTTEEDAE